MKLLELQVEGYRSLKNVTWKPGDLNVIIGPNGSGKTNLVKALRLLAVAARGGLKKYIVEQGGMQTICWDREMDEVDLKVTGSVQKQTAPKGKLVDTFSYDLTFDVWEGGLDYSISEQLVRSLTTGEGDSSAKVIKLIDRPMPRGASVFSQKPEGMESILEEVEMHETVLSVIRGTAAGYESLTFRRSLENWTIYRALNTDQDAPIRRAVPAQWEKELAEDGSNLVQYLHTFCSEDRSFKRDLELAMQAAFGDDFEELVFAPASDQRIQMRIRWRNLKNAISAPDLSDGTLRFLFLIGALLNPEPPPLIVIEEPEIGLHPRMMSIIAEYAVDAAERTQVVFTTHSPDFLSAFRDTIPTTTVCNWENGETVLRVLKDEDLEYWLKEYTLGQFAFSGAAEAVE